MSTFEGVDYAAQRAPSIEQLQGANKHFVVRYITDPAPGNKGISRTEYESLSNAGIRTVFVWEGGAQGALEGFEQGRSDAEHAQKNLVALGASPYRPLYFAIDFDATPAQQTAVNSYFEGVASVIGLHRTRAYGGYWPLTRLLAADLITGSWQTYAWSGSNTVKGRDLFQYDNDVRIGSGEVDLCRSYTDNYGQRSVLPSKVEADPHATHRVTSKHTPEYYTIRSGDTLTSIAHRFNVSTGSLVKLNKLRNPNLIVASRKLRIH